MSVPEAMKGTPPSSPWGERVVPPSSFKRGETVGLYTVLSYNDMCVGRKAF